MDRIIYTSMTGANAAAHRQAVLSHNLANVSTHGFRAEMANFRSVPLQGSGAATRVFALEATSGHVDTAGPAQTTGRPLEIVRGLLRGRTVNAVTAAMCAKAARVRLEMTTRAPGPTPSARNAPARRATSSRSSRKV